MEKEKFEKIRTALFKDLEELVSIPSYQQSNTKADLAPFGVPIRKAFDCFARIAKEKGFVVEDDEGYAITAQIGEGKEYIGVLAHLDVVEAGDLTKWNTPPFELCSSNGMLYGRGVNDDKGPMLAALYAAMLLKEEKKPLRYAIRIIAGGAEETTWECMEHYFKTHEQPLCGFSPDGNFPIVNGEKGILQVSFKFPLIKNIQAKSSQRLNYVCDHFEITLPEEVQQNSHPKTYVYQGTRCLSRNPQKGENALFAFVKEFKNRNDLPRPLMDCINLINTQFLDDFYGEKCGIYSEDREMGETSVCPMSITCDDSTFELCVDIRYVKSTNKEKIMQRLQNIAKEYRATIEVIKHKRILYVDEKSELIQALQKAYTTITHETGEVITKGGASYARVLDNGVAFGATFPQEEPNPHMPNECMPMDSLLKACAIYYEALYELAVDKEKLK